MYPFCPHCGATLEAQHVASGAVVCGRCGKPIGAAPPVDPAEELIRRGVAARCPLCRQLVEVRTRETGRTFVPHYEPGSQHKLCAASGKPVAPAAPATGGKDLSALMTREVIRVVSCPREGEPQIEELSLAYLDKADRVRTQIEALREVLGPDFRMGAYPESLNRPHLAVWASGAACVVACKHERGGYQPTADAELAQVADDLRQHRGLFFPC
jgi:hypothetical protein